MRPGCAWHVGRLPSAGDVGNARWGQRAYTDCNKLPARRFGRVGGKWLWNRRHLRHLRIEFRNQKLRSPAYAGTAFGLVAEGDQASEGPCI